MKRYLFFLLCVVVASNAQAGANDRKANQNLSLSKIAADSIPPDQTGMRNLTSVQLAKEMVPGWNVGNSLEAIGGETGWGNPLITQTLIDSIKAAGFKSVRIPVAWSNGMDASTFAISPTLLARVEEVVNYVLNNEMYAIINIHWDNGWMQPTYAQQEYVNNRLAVLWEQIAVHFRDYDDHLLFAGTNEVMVEGNYGTPTTEYYTVQNSFNQTFVTAVRSTGGRNVYRHLAVQGFNTNINYTVSYFAIPNDATANRLMVEVHYYDPYDFTLNTGSTITQWGKYATEPGKTQTWANESYVDAQFQKMKTKFIDNGYAVILGEYGAIARLNLASEALNAEHALYRRYYVEYITWSLCKHGIVPIYWDNGGTGNNGLGLFYRSNGAKAYPAIIKGIMNAVDTVNVPTRVESSLFNSIPAEFDLSQNYPNPFNPSTNISFTLPLRTEVSLKVFDMMGREVATIASGEMPAGSYTRKWDASAVSSGIYFSRLQAGPFVETKKLLLIR